MAVAEALAESLLGVGKRAGAAHRLDEVRDRLGRVHVAGDMGDLHAVHPLGALGLDVAKPSARVYVHARGFARGGGAALARLDDLGPGLLRDRVAGAAAREPGAVAGRDEAGLLQPHGGTAGAQLHVELGHLLGAAEREGAGGLDLVAVTAGAEGDAALEGGALESVGGEAGPQELLRGRGARLLGRGRS